MKKLLLLIIALLLPTGLWAQSTSIPREFPAIMRGVRPLGMGNAFIAMPGTDENAIFYNPAAINDYEKKYHFRVLSPAVDISTGIIGFTKDVLDLKDKINGDPDNASKTRDFRNFVDTHAGEFESGDLSLPLVTMMHKWFAASLFVDSRNAFSLRNRAFTNVELQSKSFAGGTIGGAYGFFDEQLEVGANVKVTHELLIDQTITNTDIINNANFGDIIKLNRGTGVGFDLGAKGSIPTFGNSILELLKPTAGFVWQDVGNTRFSGEAADIPQSIGIGIAVHPMWGKWTFHFDNDFRELNRPESFVQKWNVGLEAMGPRYWKFLTPSARIGSNQGYLTAGAGLDLRYFKLEFATYAEEAGIYSRQKGIRRIAANISFGF